MLSNRTFPLLVSPLATSYVLKLFKQPHLKRLSLSTSGEGPQGLYFQHVSQAGTELS